jgi:hypothetical protein
MMKDGMLGEPRESGPPDAPGGARDEVRSPVARPSTEPATEGWKDVESAPAAPGETPEPDKHS